LNQQREQLRLPPVSLGEQSRLQKILQLKSVVFLTAEHALDGARGARATYENQFVAIEK